MRCTKCSPGCDNCWHLRTADRLKNNLSIPRVEAAALAGVGPFILRTRELSAPLRAKKPAVIGVQFMGDLFHESVPDDFRVHAAWAMAGAFAHTFLVLTKRPEEMAGFWKRWAECPPANVYNGLTVCNQAEWDEKGPIFMQVPGLKFISHEPALEHIDYGPDLKEIAVLISGAETGSGARPSHPNIFRSDRDQCAAAGVPFFLKSLGEWLLCDDMVDRGMDWKADKHEFFEGFRRVGKKGAGRLLDGREHNSLPWCKNEK